MDLIDNIEITKNKVTIVSNDYLTSNFLTEDFFVQYAPDVDISGIDETILSIPYLLNIAPVLWYSGEKYSLEKMDKNLYYSLKKIKDVMVKMYPEINWTGELHAEILVDNLTVPSDSNNSKKAVLFSGGLDSVCTTFRHYNSYQLLITICGNDIDLNNKSGWNNVVEQNEEFARKYEYDHTYILSNFKSFLNSDNLNSASDEIDGWWGNIQHGMGLTGLTAPMIAEKELINLFISATHSTDFNGRWGSSPDIDSNIKWGNVNVTHDGYEFNRQAKISYIVDFCKENNINYPELRVCYSRPLGKGGNCGKCEKCLRTMTGILVEGQEITDFGFNVPKEKAVNLIKENYSATRLKMTSNLEFAWKTMQKRASFTLESQNIDAVTKDYLVWLSERDITEYRKSYERSNKRGIKEVVKKYLKKNPALFQLSRIITSKIMRH